MINEQAILVDGYHITIHRNEHGDVDMQDYEVRDLAGDPLGTLWEFDNRWWVKTPLFGAIDSPTMTDALEVLVKREKRTEERARLNFTPLDQTDWVVDGEWHRVAAPMPVTGLLAVMLNNTCPNGPIDPFNEGLDKMPEGERSFSFDSGHGAFEVIVKEVEVWGWMATPGSVSEVGQTSRPQRYSITGGWQELLGTTSFVTAYRMESC